MRRLPPGFYYSLSGIPLTYAGSLCADLFNLSYKEKGIFVICLFTFLVFITLGSLKELEVKAKATGQIGRFRKMFALYGMLGSSLAFSAFAIAYFWAQHENERQTVSLNKSTIKLKENNKPLTMKQVFDSDFPGVGKNMAHQEMIIESKKIVFDASQYWDIPTDSYFMSFLMDSNSNVIKMSRVIAGAMSAIITNIGQTEIEVSLPGDFKLININTMYFSKQVYLYVDQEIPLDDQIEIEKIFKEQNYNVHIYTRTYLILHWNEHNRRPVSASDSGISVSLPRSVPGTSFKVKNNTGSLPPFTNVPIPNYLDQTPPTEK